MGKRGEYWETAGGNLVDPPEVTEASKSKEHQQPSQKDVGQGTGDSASPSTDSHSMDGTSGSQPKASSDAKGIDPGDGSQESDSKENFLDGEEAASKETNDESRDQAESGSSFG